MLFRFIGNSMNGEMQHHWSIAAGIRMGKQRSEKTAQNPYGQSTRTGDGHLTRTDRGHFSRTDTGQLSRTENGHFSRTGRGHFPRTDTGQLTRAMTHIKTDLGISALIDNHMSQRIAYFPVSYISNNLGPTKKFPDVADTELHRGINVIF